MTPFILTAASGKLSNFKQSLKQLKNSTSGEKQYTNPDDLCHRRTKVNVCSVG